MARSLGVSDCTLWYWVNEDRKAHRRADDPTPLNADDATELKRWRKENAQRREDVEIRRTAAAYFAKRDAAVTGCHFVHDHQVEHVVSDLGRVMDLPRSTSYTWLDYQPSQRAWVDNALLSGIEEIHALSRDTHDAPRILGQLRHSGHRVGRYRVSRIMVEHGLVGVYGRKKWRRGKPDTAYSPDLPSVTSARRDPATAKREIEFLHGSVRQLTKSRLRTTIFEYVEVLYNRERHQAILGHLTPAEYYATAKVA